MTDPLDFVPSGFFAWRTPLEPFDALLDWGRGVAAPGASADGLEAALAADRLLLRERLRALLARPEVREAVFVASPTLDESLGYWFEQPEGERGQKVERSLSRYVARMAGRATPFGLFAGCSVGQLGETTRLELAERARYGRHTRLDMDYVSALADVLARDPVFRRALPHRPNSSLYSSAGQWRYAEARLAGKARSYHLVAVERTDYLDATLRHAAAGARPAALAETLAAAAEVELDEAAGFIDELCESQLLVPELAPPVTGPEPVHGMAELLRSTDAGGELAMRLDAAQRAIEALDAAGVGNPPEAYRAIARGLEALPTPVELPRLFQVDMVKPSVAASLGPAVVEELNRAVQLLRRLSPVAGRARDSGALGRFKEAFRERYEDREVPLAQALDEDAGIGFDKGSEASAEGSPLLEGLAFPGRGGEEGGPRWSGRDLVLMSRLLARGVTTELVLDDKDVEALAAAGDKPPLPDAFAIMAALSAATPEALAAGDFKLFVRGGGGPSGANFLGRFCHGDPALEQLVRDHIRDEEALRPAAVFAELVHLPEGRVGNVLARPLLRTWEIPYLGRSGAAHEQQLPVDDLWVSIREDRVVLRSQRLDREVLPRLTTAHNFSSPRNLGVYRFLCEVQLQGSLGVPGWTWGGLDGLEALPRVRHGRLVLARARWRLKRARFEPVTKAKQAGARWRAAQALRAELGWPRFIEVADADNELPVDLDNVLSIDTFAHLIKDRGEVELVEMWPAPEELCAHGPEGRFTHELVVPFTRRPKEAAAKVAPVRPPADGPRSFAPGSEWLYAKIYLGPGYGDRVLRESIAPVVAHALASGAADRWFFIRYGDPAWHLRIRFHGDPARLRAEIEPALHDALAGHIERGGVHRVVLDTYERELERYGGARGIELAERLFAADSDAALALVEGFAGDGASDLRWRLALRGMDQLLTDLGFELVRKLELLRQIRGSFGREFNVGTATEKQLGDKFRKQRAALEALLDPARDADSPHAELLAVLARRSTALATLRPAIDELAATLSLDALASSFLHMHANRILRSAARPQELVIYDFLVRLYESRVARARKK